QRRSSPSPSTLELVIPVTAGELSPSQPSSHWTAPAAVASWSFVADCAALHHRRRFSSGSILAGLASCLRRTPLFHLRRHHVVPQ
ncbi:hypothetical protein S245_055436, partial [Arachis hypogaea]